MSQIPSSVFCVTASSSACIIFVLLSSYLFCVGYMCIACKNLSTAAEYAFFDLQAGRLDVLNTTVKFVEISSGKLEWWVRIVKYTVSRTVVCYFCYYNVPI